ncbi:MAG: hypothetical protein C0600_05915 [Ignavibacteria bacterium]|nr:MAG: hypothetical protein C0600_05915 [Ignavibacteria bacterium]
MIRSLLAGLFLLLLTHQLSAQCSDAGACSIGGHVADENQHSISLGYGYGSSGGDEALTFHSVQIDGRFQVLDGSNVFLSLPYNSVDGPLGSASGIGDLTILLMQEVWTGDEGMLSLQAGGKIATGTVNEGGLPQAYQSGLGTNDILLGVSYETAPWNFAAGYLLSNGRSDNDIDRLERGDDLFARAGYRTSFDDIGAGLEILVIKRLSESTVQDPGRPGEDRFITLPDSDQLQVNIVATSSIPMSDDLTLNLLAGMPLLARDVNVDGLKRALTLSAGMAFSF